MLPTEPKGFRTPGVFPIESCSKQGVRKLLAITVNKQTLTLIYQMISKITESLQKISFSRAIDPLSTMTSQGQIQC